VRKNRRSFVFAGSREADPALGKTATAYSVTDL
jgi:hypothetical protein